MTNQSMINIVLRLREYRKNHPEYTLQNIADNTDVSFSTVSRVFSDTTDPASFRHDSISPIAKYMLDLDDLSDGNDEEKTLKAILQYKDSTIEYLKNQLIIEKQSHTESLAKEQMHSSQTIGFMKQQIEIKDEKINDLLDMLKMKDSQNAELNALLTKILHKVFENKDMLIQILKD